MEPEDRMSDQPQRLRDLLAADPLLLTPEEAASVLRVGRTTVYALMKSGDLHAVHIGRSCRLSRAELRRYVDRLAAGQRPTPSTSQRRRRTSTNRGELFDVVPKPATRPRAVDSGAPVSGPTTTLGRRRTR
jgi:excisionase family DNA binding protein